MSKRIFTEEQIKTLLQNPNVAGCSEKSITYNKEFKILAVRKWQEGLPSNEIFRQARFDIHMIGRKTPRYCLKRWRKVVKLKGETGLRTDGRGTFATGRRKNSTNLTDREKMEQLEAEIAYLKEENLFLAKLRKERLNYDHANDIRSSDH